MNVLGLGGAHSGVGAEDDRSRTVECAGRGGGVAARPQAHGSPPQPLSGGSALNIPLADAAPVLTDLLRRAEAGEEVTLTQSGRPVARLVAVGPDVAAGPPCVAARRALMAERAARTRARLLAGQGADQVDARGDAAPGLPG